MSKLAFATDRQLRLAKPKLSDYRIGCGERLFLRITPTGFKYWQIRYYKPNGSESLYQFGSYPKLSLVEARKHRDDIMPSLLAGIFTPQSASGGNSGSVGAVGSKDATTDTLSFNTCAEKYIAAKQPEWKNAKHAQQWANTLGQYASPVFGKLAVSAINRQHVLACLEPIWLTKNETASRLRGRIEAVLDWAKARDMRSGENPAAWKGGLQNLLAAPSRTQKTKSHPFLPYAEVPAFMQRLKHMDGQSALALQFLILTASRTTETTDAQWSELQGDVWVIPEDRMKKGIEHRIPLSEPALALLATLPRSGLYMFPRDALGEKPLSNMAMAMLLRRMGMDKITVHGFRTSFRMWSAEKTNYPKDVCERALSHQLVDKVEAAYMRSDFLELRRGLMRDWGGFCAVIGST